jgi:hypothetical protein
MESIEQTFNGSADFGKKVTCTISRNGDLMFRTYLQVTLPEIALSASTDKFRWLNWVGHVLIKHVELEIGGQRIDKHYGDWLHIWNELTQKSGLQSGYANMVGNVPALTQIYSGGKSSSEDTVIPEVTLFIPLQFFFCRNPGLALPLIALQYHEVKINLEFRDARECFWATGKYASQSPVLRAASLYVDYIYLDTDERRRFAQVSHEYLIEQLQFTGDETVVSSASKIKLNFNHPCKELVWVVQPDSNTDISGTKGYGGPQWFNYTDAIDQTWFSGTPSDPLGGGVGGDAAANMFNPNVLPFTEVQTSSGLIIDASGNPLESGGIQDLGALTSFNSYPLFDSGCNPVSSAKLQLNGHDRFSQRDGRYFNLVQPYQHHENVPETGINVYSFGLKPEEHQPSGTCNFSRIDNATLQLNLTKAAVVGGRSCKVKVYATNYNVLRIMSGMGGLAYSN